MPDGTDHDSLQKVESIDEARQDRKRQDRKERAVKEREDKIKAERGRVEALVVRAREGINKEEGEREFRCAIAIKILLYIDLWRLFYALSCLELC